MDSEQIEQQMRRTREDANILAEPAGAARQWSGRTVAAIVCLAVAAVLLVRRRQSARTRVAASGAAVPSLGGVA